MGLSNYYDILGCDVNDTDEVVKKAYRRKALEHHPDRHADATDIIKEQHTEKFKELSTAYAKIMKARSGTTRPRTTDSDSDADDFEYTDFLDDDILDLHANTQYHVLKKKNELDEQREWLRKNIPREYFICPLCGQFDGYTEATTEYRWDHYDHTGEHLDTSYSDGDTLSVECSSCERSICINHDADDEDVEEFKTEMMKLWPDETEARWKENDR